MKSPRSLAICVVAVLSFLQPPDSHSQATARTLQRSLDQLIAESDCIVHGVVLSTNIERHPVLHNLMTEVVTVKVADTYKGKAQKTLVFRQYVWNTAADKAASDYHKGQELVLFLRPVSEYGLRSPAGLEQGRFRITLDRNHRAVAVNGRGNVGLFDNLEQNARAEGVPLSQHLATVVGQRHLTPLALTDLEQLIHTFAEPR